ncbi:hypothetical protein [Chamaesiphon minutus]|uniref:Uncharacterized protein n=1 Tax=Chamaesiphon minutus (strain ATCC 27169 / PCC 6605) TaxID=1173020 RepID=K9UQV0_CHAP6|nr:hypothetical protein [Chamaesiphon minutus]AFY96816.1 hypothetical protein Cha6605_5971 [Chamaesiphon minutus PCC 6605]
MKSSIFTREFFTQTKANTKQKNNHIVKDIIINGRVFHYDPVYKEYVDSKLAGFLKKSPDEEDYWEFSGDGFDIWFAGTFAEVKSDLEEYWEPEPLDRIELILLRLWKEFRSIEKGDIICQIGHKPQKVIALHPEIENLEAAFSCQSSDGKIRRVNFKDWRDDMWEIESRASNI